MKRKLRSGLSAFLLPAIAAIFFVPCSAAAAPGDFDGDGTSDLSVSLVARNSSSNTGSTAWLTRPSNGGTAMFWTWSVPGDASVRGRFYANDPKSYPGVVWVRSSSLPLEWYIKNSANQDVFLTYGLPGDTIPPLGDFDGDGIDDIAVVRPGSDNALHWLIALSGSVRIVDYVFGANGDLVGIVDVDGDGISELVVLRRDTYMWYVRKMGQDTFTQVQWGLNGDIPLMPMDLDGDNLADYIIARRTGYLQLAYIRYGNGQTATMPLGFDTSIPQLGNFTGTPGFAWNQRDTGWSAIRNADSSLQLFRHSISTNAVIRPDGTVVTATLDGRFPASSSSGTPTPDSGSSSCSSVLSSGWLLKPASQDSGGTRQGKPLILFSRNYPSSSCLNVIATNGSIVAHYGRFTGDRYYSGWGCGEGYSGSTIASRAMAAAGSKNIYVQDPANSRCYGPGPADGRTDRR